MAAPSILAESSLARRDRRAFTLTELSIVLGVIGLVLGGIWVAAGQAYQAQKATKAANQVQQIFTGYKTIYAAKGIDDPTDNDDVTCLGMNAKAFPSDMYPAVIPCVTGTNTTYPQSPWGQPVFVSLWKSTNTILIGFRGSSSNGTAIRVQAASSSIAGFLRGLSSPCAIFRGNVKV